MRRLLLVVPVLIAVGCVTACSSSGHVDDKQTRAAITSLFTREAAGTPVNPSCPGTLNAKAGASIQCTASDGSGTAWPVTVTVDRIESGTADLRATFTDLVVSVGEAQTKITEMYRQVSDSDVASVDCKGLQKLAAGSTRDCTVHEVGGKTVPVTLKILNVKGTEYSYEVDQNNK